MKQRNIFLHQFVDDIIDMFYIPSEEMSFPGDLRRDKM